MASCAQFWYSQSITISTKPEVGKMYEVDFLCR